MIEKKSLEKRNSLHKGSFDLTTFFVISFLLGVVALVTFTLFRGEYLPGDDWAYHMARIEGIKDGILSGEFPVKIHSQLLNGYGYGNGLFYPSLFLYIPAFFRILGLDMIFSYKLFVFLIVVSITLSSYFCAQNILCNKFASLCATLLFVSSHMVIANIYWRSAAGEMLATIFIPIVIYGVYNLLYENYSKPWAMILGFSGLVFSHLITLVFAVFFTGIAVMIHFIVFFKKEQILKGRKVRSGLITLRNLLGSAVLVLLLTCAFWIPMLEQMASDVFQYSQAYLAVSEEALSLSEVLLFSKASLGLPIAVFSCIVLCLRFLSLTKKDARKILSFDVFLLIGILLSLFATDIFPWKWFEQLLNPIQFPWRILTLASFFLALGIAGICSQHFQTRTSKILLLSILCVLCSVFCVSMINIRWDVFHTDKSVNIYQSKDAEGVGKEWLPLHTDPSLLVHSGIVVTDQKEEIKGSQRGTMISFPVVSKNEYYDVPLIYYKGYSACFEKPDGSKTNVQIIKTDNNTVRVIPPEDTKGIITVAYTGTALQTASYAMTVATILLIVYLFFQSRLLRRKTSLDSTKEA